jgi:Protein of unknown function (DUF3293)
LVTGNAITPDKLAAYRATQYRVGAGEDAITLRIGSVSGELQKLYVETGQNCCVFITAYNPFGQEQSADANRLAHSQLEKALRALRSRTVGGVGADPGGAWPEEVSVLALGIDETTARQLGKRFKQDAVVWAGSDATPQLLVLR